MSTRSLSSKMAKSAAKSAAKLTASVSTGDESSLMDMILMGAGVAVIILLLVYIYNRFIHKQPAKNEYFDGAAAPSVDTSKCPVCPVCPKCDCGTCGRGYIRNKEGKCVLASSDDN